MNRCVFTSASGEKKAKLGRARLRRVSADLRITGRGGVNAGSCKFSKKNTRTLRIQLKFESRSMQVPNACTGAHKYREADVTDQ